MKEKIDMLLERLEAYRKFNNSSVSEFGRGYSKGWERAFDDAIFLVELYLKKEGETNE